MDWEVLKTNDLGLPGYVVSKCAHCGNFATWRGKSFNNRHYHPWDIGYIAEAELLYPDFGAAPLADKDMPDDVKADYEEASRIFSRSPRGAAALLRLALQKLCKHLGEKGENINQDIRALAEKNTLPPLVVKVADTVRITGNNAVHPGEMSDEDFDRVASKMFELINFIVRKGISEPKELEALYQATPESQRKAAEGKDAKARGQTLLTQ